MPANLMAFRRLKDLGPLMRFVLECISELLSGEVKQSFNPLSIFDQ